MAVIRTSPIWLGGLSLALAACSGEVPGDPTDNMFGDSAGSDNQGADSDNDGTAGTGGVDNPLGDDDATADDALGDDDGTGVGLGDDSVDDDSDDVDPDVIDAVNNAQPLPMTLNGEPIFARTVRLTHSQWERSVRYLLQLDAPTGEQSGLSLDAEAVNDFSNNEDTLFVSSVLWNDYATAARNLSRQVASDADAMSRIFSGTDPQQFINEFGRKAFRRPLEQSEVQDYLALYETGAGLREAGASDFARGAGFVIEAMLQSPHFLYRVELTGPGERLSGFEIAAKLSLLLRGATPDDALLDAAASGQLDSDANIMTFAQSMVNEDGVLDVMREYHGELFRFNRYLTIEKDQQTVPEFSPELREELQEASYLYFDRLFRDSMGVAEMLTSDFAFAGPRMAALYGVQAPANGFAEVTLGEDRPGYFTQLPFLILNSVNLVPDSIHRGVALNLEVLCADVPPPTVTTVSLPPFDPEQSNRERVTAGTGPGTCGASCHGVYINPLGFAFEGFDGMGRVRTEDAGKTIDASGSYPFAEGTESFQDVNSLMDVMAQGGQVYDCYSKKMAGFALQRDLTEDDRPLVDALSAASQSPDSSIKQMLLTLVTDPLFTTRPVGGAQ